MDYTLTPAGESDRAIIRNLAKFYFYDMAEHGGWPFPGNGEFDIENRLENYWGLPGFRVWPAHWKGFAFLIRVDGHPAGFALVKQIGPDTYDMGEFFIGRQYRRKGLGEKIATQLFDQFKGHWELRELTTNTGAQAFWRKIVADYTGGDFTDGEEEFDAYDNVRFVVQRFRSRSGP
ncbi:MAG TPA: GNAT family N-acetyltransferase [Rhizomicrobium sp.]|jgi:predicted acetyltransferase